MSGSTQKHAGIFATNVRSADPDAYDEVMTSSQRERRLEKIAFRAHRLGFDSAAARSAPRELLAPPEVAIEARIWRMEATSTAFISGRQPFWRGRW